MVKFGNAAKVEDALKKVNIPYVIFDGANTEPTDKIVEAGLKVYKDNDCDFIIALGGGSPMDTAKAIGFMTTAGDRKINSYMHEVIDMPVPYLVAIRIRPLDKNLSAWLARASAGFSRRVIRTWRTARPATAPLRPLTVRYLSFMSQSSRRRTTPCT